MNYQSILNQNNTTNKIIEYNPHTIKSGQLLFVQWSHDIDFDYSTGRFPSGDEEAFDWEENYIPVNHYIGETLVGATVWRREKAGENGKWTSPIKLTGFYIPVEQEGNAVKSIWVTEDGSIFYQLEDGSIVSAGKITPIEDPVGDRITGVSFNANTMVLTLEGETQDYQVNITHKHSYSGLNLTNNNILVGNNSNNAIELPIPEQTLVGRITGQSIDSLSVAEVRTLISNIGTKVLDETGLSNQYTPYYDLVSGTWKVRIDNYVTVGDANIAGLNGIYTTLGAAFAAGHIYINFIGSALIGTITTIPTNCTVNLNGYSLNLGTISISSSNTVIFNNGTIIIDQNKNGSSFNSCTNFKFNLISFDLTSFKLAGSYPANRGLFTNCTFTLNSTGALNDYFSPFSGKMYDCEFIGVNFHYNVLIVESGIVKRVKFTGSFHDTNVVISEFSNKVLITDIIIVSTNVMFPSFYINISYLDIIKSNINLKLYCRSANNIIIGETKDGTNKLTLVSDNSLITNLECEATPTNSGTGNTIHYKKIGYPELFEIGTINLPGLTANRPLKLNNNNDIISGLYPFVTVGNSAIAGNTGDYTTLQAALTAGNSLIEFVGSTSEVTDITTSKEVTINLNGFSIIVPAVYKFNNIIYNCIINNGKIIFQEPGILTVITGCTKLVFNNCILDLSYNLYTCIISGNYNNCKFIFEGTTNTYGGGLGYYNESNYTYTYFVGTLNNCEITATGTYKKYPVICYLSSINGLTFTGLFKDTETLLRAADSDISNLNINVDSSLTNLNLELLRCNLDNLRSTESLTLKLSNLTDAVPTVFNNNNIKNIVIGTTTSGSKTLNITSSYNNINNCQVESAITDSGIDNNIQYKLF